MDEVRLRRPWTGKGGPPDSNLSGLVDCSGTGCVTSFTGFRLGEGDENVFF